MEGNIVHGPSGEKVGYYKNINEEMIKSELAEKTWIRWLVRNEDGAPTFSLRYFRINPSGHINSHSHPWEHEIFILKGKGIVRIGEKKYSVIKNYFLYIPPCIEHEYWSRDEELEFLCVIPNSPSVGECKSRK